MPEPEVSTLAAAAAEAFSTFSASPDALRADLLDRIAAGLEAAGDDLLTEASRETALPMARLTGERGRTCAQLRMFATLLRAGTWRSLRFESADPSRTPVPKPDLRRTMVPIGPVAVFGASNFPLAFSVPGGDTASALAAGCPVVVKAHPGHVETSRRCAEIIRAAVEALGLPDGTFGMVEGGAEVGQALAQTPEIAAVAFTGSLRAGRALFDLAARRPRPIPVYAEMGSVNPIFLLPGALSARGSSLAEGYAGSLTLGVGQFCTNPGVVVGVDGDDWRAFLRQLVERLASVPEGRMLNEAIRDAYLRGARSRREAPGVRELTQTEGVSPILFEADAPAFLADARLREELFGPSAVAVTCTDLDELRRVAAAFEGELTATLHFETDDHPEVARLLPLLQRFAGRIVANGYPTGVEVNSAMQHGGPYPASTDARTTSVGTDAILRFVRPIAFQDFPVALLPTELQTTA